MKRNRRTWGVRKAGELGHSQKRRISAFAFLRLPRFALLALVRCSVLCVFFFCAGVVLGRCAWRQLRVSTYSASSSCPGIAAEVLLNDRPQRLNQSINRCCLFSPRRPLSACTRFWRLSVRLERVPFPLLCSFFFSFAGAQGKPQLGEHRGHEGAEIARPRILGSEVRQQGELPKVRWQMADG